jgi:hypothetical protein
VLGILDGAIVAVLFGHVALNDIKATGEEGRGMVIAAWSSAASRPRSGP